MGESQQSSPESSCSSRTGSRSDIRAYHAFIIAHAGLEGVEHISTGAFLRAKDTSGTTLTSERIVDIAKSGYRHAESLGRSLY